LSPSTFIYMMAFLNVSIYSIRRIKSCQPSHMFGKMCRSRYPKAIQSVIQHWKMMSLSTVACGNLLTVTATAFAGPIASQSHPPQTPIPSPSWKNSGCAKTYKKIPTCALPVRYASSAMSRSKPAANNGTSPPLADLASASGKHRRTPLNYCGCTTK